MKFIALSIICSVVVSVLLKLAPKARWDVRQMIAGGYLVAASLCWITLRPAPSALFNNETSLTVWSLLLALGVLLPSLFIALAKSVEQTGIVLTDAAQRLSLLLPLLAAFLFFGENFTWLKGLGLGLGLIAMLLI